MGATRIAPKLWMAGADIFRRPTPIDCDLVVLCAKEHQFREWGHMHPTGAAILRVPLDDSEAPTTDHELHMADRAAEIVTAFVRAGGRVLVTCAKGRNRSGLVTALALKRLTGWDGWQCVQHVRAMREPDAGRLVLCRTEFVNHVVGSRVQEESAA